MANARVDRRAVFVSFFGQNSIGSDSNNFELLLPTLTENGDSDLSHILKFICSEKPSLSAVIKNNSIQFEKESTYFPEKYVEITANTKLEHGAVIRAKVVKRCNQDEACTTTREHGELKMLNLFKLL
jgi:hypothetical protein